jgi:hypothetical protein
MVTKKVKTQEEKKGRVKVDKLQVNKETVKDLSDKDVKDVKGGGFIMRDTVIIPRR